MVYRYYADISQWDVMKSIVPVFDLDRDHFARSVLKYCTDELSGLDHPDQPIERVEVYIPNVLTIEERHSMYKLNKRPFIDITRITDAKYGECMECMCVRMSKSYVQYLFQLPSSPLQQSMVKLSILDDIDE